MTQTAILSYVVNALWQAPLVFLAAWVAARLARRVSVTLEHRIWTSALVLQSVLPACPTLPTGTLRELWGILSTIWHRADTPASTQITTSTAAGYAHTGVHLPANLITAILVIYISTLLYFAGRLIHSLFKTRELRLSARPFPEKGNYGDAGKRLAAIFRVPNVQIATSPLIATPSTIGVRCRMLLLPSNLPDSVCREDLEAAVAHEFAHIHRRDFALNLIYRIIALPVAFHPALWLTSSRINETREMICDSLAAETLAFPPAERHPRYARSLIRLASILIQDKPVSSLHAIGIFDANIFERRLMNLTHAPAPAHAVRRLVTAAGCLVLGLCACASALALRTAPLTAAPGTRGEPALNPVSVLGSVPPAAPQPQTSQVPRISGGVIAGNRLYGVAPVYPPDAKAAKLSGSVVLHAIIAVDGSIEKLEVVSGPEIFQQSALDAVHQWKYKPYILNGEPTAVDTTITINYSIPKGKD